jgi:hypothetical protein
LINDLKDFLADEEKWGINIFILLYWKEIDTNMFIRSIESLEEWEEENLS